MPLFCDSLFIKCKNGGDESISSESFDRIAALRILVNFLSFIVTFIYNSTKENVK